MNSSGMRSPRKSKGQGGERREEILAASLKLFTELGIFAVSTRQIAQAVGISQPTLYAYFPTKDDIGIELHSRAFQALAQRIAQHLNSPISTIEDFQAMLQIYVDFGLENPDMYRLAFMSDTPQLRNWWAQPSAPNSPPMDAAFRMLEGKVVELSQQGYLRLGEPTIFAQSIWAGMHGLVSLLISKPMFPWAERSELIAAHMANIARGVWRLSQ